MRTRNLLFTLFVAFATLAVPATASAAFQHTVMPGESLSSVAAADGLSVDQLAAANGISPDTELTAGATLAIPPQGAEASSYAAPAYGTQASDESTTTGESSDTGTDEAAPESTGTPESSGGGGYLVQPGDTLSQLAADYGTTVDQLAAENGLDPNGLLLAGSTINVGGGGGSSAGTSEEASESTPAPQPEDSGGPEPTQETVTPSYVGSVAAENGVPSSLAEAIGDQESGFNNDEVSSTGATGVMQIEPGTWNYIGQTLATPPPLQPDSAADNVRGGVLLLRSLLQQTGGNEALAAAGYYQGLPSVEQHGEYSDTQQYVNDVMALQHQFGG